MHARELQQHAASAQRRHHQEVVGTCGGVRRETNMVIMEFSGNREYGQHLLVLLRCCGLHTPPGQPIVLLHHRPLCGLLAR